MKLRNIYDHPLCEVLKEHNVSFYGSPSSFSITDEKIPSEVISEIAKYDAYLYLDGDVNASLFVDMEEIEE